MPAATDLRVAAKRSRHGLYSLMVIWHFNNLLGASVLEYKGRDSFFRKGCFYFASYHAPVCVIN